MSTCRTYTYQLTDHLGNVRALITDRKRFVQLAPGTGIVDIDGNGTVDGEYRANLSGYYNYYAFGMEQPGRCLNAENYRYGFNGKEKDNEIKGGGNSYDFGARMYDPRVGRFLSLDPWADKFPWQSPYCFADDMPILKVDFDGKGGEITSITWINGQAQANITINVILYSDNPATAQNYMNSGALAGAQPLLNTIDYVTVSYDGLTFNAVPNFTINVTTISSEQAQSAIANEDNPANNYFHVSSNTQNAFAKGWMQGNTGALRTDVDFLEFIEEWMHGMDYRYKEDIDDEFGPNGNHPPGFENNSNPSIMADARRYRSGEYNQIFQWDVNRLNNWSSWRNKFGRITRNFFTDQNTRLRNRTQPPPRKIQKAKPVRGTNKSSKPGKMKTGRPKYVTRKGRLRTR